MKKKINKFIAARLQKYLFIKAKPTFVHVKHNFMFITFVHLLFSFDLYRLISNKCLRKSHLPRYGTWYNFFSLPNSLCLLYHDNI